MASPYEPDHEPVIVRGLVIPADWDNEGRIVGVFIATADEDQYFVRERDVVGPLLERLREEVILSGIVQEADGKKLLTQCRLSDHNDHDV